MRILLGGNYLKIAYALESFGCPREAVYHRMILSAVEMVTFAIDTNAISRAIAR